MNGRPTDRTPLGQGVIEARAKERDARLRAEKFERQAAVARREWQRAVKIRERAEAWFEADYHRTEAAKHENIAANISL